MFVHMRHLLRRYLIPRTLYKPAYKATYLALLTISHCIDIGIDIDVDDRGIRNFQMLWKVYQTLSQPNFNSRTQSLLASNKVLLAILVISGFGSRRQEESDPQTESGQYQQRQNKPGFVWTGVSGLS
jgi:hypothetical protein